MDWSPPPEPMTWVLPKPISFGSASYPTVTVRAPCAGDVLKAQAIPGSSNMNISLRLIAALSVEQVPFEALAQAAPNGLPMYVMDQIAAYFDMFGGAPIPGPLEAWRQERIASAKVEASPAT